MPTNLVKSKKDEELWARAKTQAEKAGHAGDWAYITSIFQTMKGKKMSKAAFLGMGQIFRRQCQG